MGWRSRFPAGMTNKAREKQVPCGNDKKGKGKGEAGSCGNDKQERQRRGRSGFPAGMTNKKGKGKGEAGSLRE